jgi:hypothetical protein
MMISYLLLYLLGSQSVQAAGKHPAVIAPKNWVGKKVVALVPVSEAQILMPDDSVHNFGDDFQASLTTRLVQSGKYLLVDPVDPPSATASGPVRAEEVTGPLPDQYYWTGSAMPSVTVKVSVSALTFQTGSRGDLMFYGFDERINTPFNPSQGMPSNDFPLKTAAGAASWFGNSFDHRGMVPLDSQSGLDLGEGFSLDFLFAFLNLKYAAYHADLHLRLELESPAIQAQPGGGVNRNFEMIEVKGDGFFFDLVGSYQQFSVGVSLARRDAMNQAVAAAIQSSYDAIDRALSSAPWLAKVDGVLDQGLVLLGTGAMSGIQTGTLYYSLQYPELVLKVIESGDSGSVSRIVAGSPNLIRHGMIFQEGDASLITSHPLLRREQSSLSVASASVPSVVDSTQLPPLNFQPPNLEGIVKLTTRLQAAMNSLAELVFLPYRIWRYFQYDQSYHAKAELGGPTSSELSQQTWQHQIGLDRVQDLPLSGAIGTPAVVAVIDSGIDYNHALLHDSLWINPNPSSDSEGRKDRYGWDFISNDSKPYDDGYHGTELASMVVQVAPEAKIMPLKIFNPWGITSSAAIFGAFQYAVDHGAQIILCGWSTLKKNQALEQGVAYARNRGVIVVAAAGDQGLSLKVFPAYPAVLSQRYDNVLSVTSVDFKDRMVVMDGKKPNYDPTGTLIQLAAPGETLWVATPRGGKYLETSTGLAAAVVAGVLARNLALKSVPTDHLIRQVLSEADHVSGLKGGVSGGARVRVVR